MSPKILLIVNCLCFIFFISACSGSNQEPTPAAATQPVVSIEKPLTVSTSPQEAQEIAKHYEVALEASRNDDWTTVDQELSQIQSLATDPTQVAVADVLLGKLKANDTLEVMVHIMKLLSQPTDKQPVYVWYREICRHAKAAEWQQLEVELQETMKIAPAEAQDQLSAFLDKVRNGDTSNLAEEIQQYTGVTEE